MRWSMVAIAIGSIVFLRGSYRLRPLAFPLALIVFMVLPPTFLHEAATESLQMLSSVLAEGALETLGSTVLLERNVFELATQRLSVVEACSGMRSLMSLGFCALIHAKLASVTSRTCLYLLVLALPIGVLANTARIVLTGVTSSYLRPPISGRLHSITGWLASLGGIAAIVILHQAAGGFRRRIHAG